MSGLVLFDRIGRIDSVGRRSLWFREESMAEGGGIQLRAGREGGDATARIGPENPAFEAILSVMLTARFAAEWESPTGNALVPDQMLPVEAPATERKDTPELIDEIAETRARLERLERERPACPICFDTRHTPGGPCSCQRSRP